MLSNAMRREKFQNVQYDPPTIKHIGVCNICMLSSFVHLLFNPKLCFMNCIGALLWDPPNRCVDLNPNQLNIGKRENSYLTRTPSFSKGLSFGNQHWKKRGR